jgi:hypothetical protein
MDEKRKTEYRYLIYRGLLDIRSSIVVFRWWNPLTWFRAMRELARVNDFANSLHNLAQFSMLDFDNFDEEQFWRDYAVYRKRYPEDRIPNYRQLFDDRMNGKERF